MAYDELGIDSIPLRASTSNGETDIYARDSAKPSKNLCTHWWVSEDLSSSDFLAKSQKGFLIELKRTPNDGEVIVVTDFVENHTTATQNKIESLRWHKRQVTFQRAKSTHSRATGVVVQKNRNWLTSYAAISEHSTNDIAAVYLFQMEMIAEVENKKAHCPKQIS